MPYFAKPRRKRIKYFYAMRSGYIPGTVGKSGDLPDWKNELFLFGYISRHCKFLKGKVFVINDHKPILRSDPYFSRSILDYIYYRYRSRCIISYKPISGIIKAAKSLPRANPKISLLVDIKGLDKVVNDRSAIIRFRKIGFNCNAVKPVKSIRSAYPDKTVFVLY